MESIQNIFVNKVKNDDRNPIIIFKSSKTLALHPPNTEFWLQVVTLYIIQSIFGLLLATMIYKFIIQKRISFCNQNDKKNNKNVSPLSHLGLKELFIGYGIIIPIAIMFPYRIIDYFDIKNRTLRFSLVCLPNAIVFRCLEAMVSVLFNPYA